NFDFVNGYVTSNDTRPITLGVDATTSGGAAGRYFNGPVRKQFNTITLFEYPVGKAGAPTPYRPFRFLPTNTNTATMRGEYFATAPPSFGSDVFGSNLLGIVNMEYWQLDDVTPSSGIQGSVHLPYVNPGSGNWRSATLSPGPDPCSNCNVAVVRRTANTGAGTWDFTALAGNFSATSSPREYRSYTDNGWIASRSGHAFSPFTIGYSFNIILQLPLQLMSFEAQAQGNTQALLNWRINDAQYLQYTVVEHSTDGITFAPAGTLPAVGAHYTYTHTPGASGVQYYRLRLHQRSGSTLYSAVKAVWLGGQPATLVSLLQNPVRRQPLLQVFSTTAGTLQWQLTDGLGRHLGRGTTAVTAGLQQLRLPTPVLATGIYYLQVFTPDGRRQTLRLAAD
ncbi:MAG TPA: hypothetical protein PKD90_16920, partial [Phnomibacter sp.]|nr:hypothetical protein [Phnomibacter sp.]